MEARRAGGGGRGDAPPRGRWAGHERHAHTGDGVKCLKSLLQLLHLRFGNMGSLSVKEISSTENPPVKRSKSPGTANVLDINNSTLMFVGGLGGQIKVTVSEYV